MKWLLLWIMIIIDYYYWLLLMIIIGDYYWLLLMIIIDDYYGDKTNFSSSINEVIRSVLFIFFTIRFHKYKKALKSTKKHQKVLKNI